MTKQILWLLGAGENRNRINYILRKIRDIYPPAANEIMFIQMNKTFKFWVPKPKTKGTFMLTRDYVQQVQNTIGVALHGASVIVVNDFGTLSALLDGETFNKKKLSTFRGGKYVRPIFGNVPAIVIDDVSKAYMPPSKNPEATLQESPSVADQLNEFDLQKIMRHHLGRNSQVPNFDERYTLYGPARGESWADENMPALQAAYGDKLVYPSATQLRAWVERQSIIALDYETQVNHASCIGFSGIENNDLQTIQTFVLPFMSPEQADNTHMHFGLFWQLLHILHNHGDALRVWANGAAFDLMYSMKYSMLAGKNTEHHDLMHLWHSFRPRLPKSLAMVSSVFDDDFYYWKEEIKGGSAEKQKQKTKHAMPQTLSGLRVYWRYCGLDCHSTLVSFVHLNATLLLHEWALTNYAREMALQQGILFHSNYVGAAADKSKLKELLDKDRADMAEAKQALITASNGVVCEELNAKKETSFATNAQLVRWLYDGLRATPGKKKADKKTEFTVDQRQLQLVAEQHPVYAKAIEYIRQYREPEQRVKMYGNMQLPYGRFNYSYTTLGTYTGRLSGRGSAFWTGTNPQNVPYPMRPMIKADEDHVLFDFDYSQADLYHFAAACGDQNMINMVMNDPRDTHAYHVELILKVPYDDVMKGKKANDPFVVHPITGVRQIIKKVTHGGNYGLTPAGAYLQIGREALEAAANYLGYDHGTWSYYRFLEFTEELVEPYHKHYAGQMDFRRRIVEECCANDGYMTCFGGLKVYFHEHKNRREHDALMRALLAFFGQGGTAGMINNAMLDLFYTPHQRNDIHYDSFLDAYRTRFLFQTHDSLSFNVPLDVVYDTDFLDAMQDRVEIPCHFNGIDYHVPVEASIGYSWGKNCVEIPRRGNNERTTTLALLESLAKTEGWK